MDNAVLVKVMIIINIIILIIFFLYKKENAGSIGSTAYSAEAVANIAKVYSDSSGVATFNNVNITGNLNTVPRGSIIAFNSETAPSGWAICDGTNGTPDLRGRFIRMWYRRTGNDVWGDLLDVNIPNATGTGDTSEKTKSSAIGDGTSYKTALMNHWFGDAGGSDWRAQTLKEMPSHTHSPPADQCGGVAWNASGGGSAPIGCTSKTPNNNTGAAGSSWGFGIQPPYYVLTWIMKL
jgi:microcystin-dependent protein